MKDRVRIEMKDGIADVRIVRPDKMNALDYAMFEALTDAGLEIANDKSVRAVVLSGEGRCFCAGLDTAVMGGLGRPADPADPPARSSRSGLAAAHSDSPANRAQRSAWIWQEVPVPVIAAVHGVTYGGGLQVALGADIRFVAPDAQLSVREVHWGLIPDVALTQTLRHIVGTDIAKELTFTARVFSGVEAVEYRIATHVSEDPYSDAMQLAREIARRSPDAVRAAKKLFNEALFGTIEEGFALERELQQTLIGSPNMVESVMANMEKREPKFRNPA